MSMPERKPRDRDRSINDLAIMHLTSHPKDRSNSILARMNRRFGRKAADEATLAAQKTLRLMDPEHPSLKREYPGNEPEVRIWRWTSW